MAAALSFVDSLWSRCCILMESGQPGQARALLKRLLQLDIPPSIRSEAALMLADLLRHQGEYVSARRHLSAALAGDPEDAALHHMLGYLHDEDDEGSESGALRHLRQAVKLAPDSSECHRALGEYLYHHTSQARGLTHLRKAVELEPDNLDSLRSLIKTLVEHEEVDSARQVIRETQFRLGRSHPTVQSLWNELAYAHTLQQQQVRSRVATVPMLKAVSDEPRAQREKGAPAILRFDRAHGQAIRPSRRRGSKTIDPRDA